MAPKVAPEQPMGSMGGPNAAMIQPIPRSRSGHRGVEANTARRRSSAAPDHRVPVAHRQAPARAPEEPSR